MTDTIEHDGARYRLYAGPYADQIDAYDRIAFLIEQGELSDTVEAPTVIGNSIYVRVNEEAPAE